MFTISTSKTVPAKLVGSNITCDCNNRYTVDICGSNTCNNISGTPDWSCNYNTVLPVYVRNQIDGVWRTLLVSGKNMVDLSLYL